MLDKSKIYVAFSKTYKGRNQSPNRRFKKIRILFEDDISYYVESLIEKDAKGFGKRFSVKKHAFHLIPILQDRGSKIWIVCDNNSKETLIPFSSLKKAKKHVEQYEDPIQKEDCWIYDEKGTEVK